MILTNLLFDVALVSSSSVGAIVGIAFFLVFAAVAFIAYKLLKKTVKMAVRMAVVIAILAIAFVGSIALLWFSSTGGKRSERPTPTTQKPR